MKDEILIAGLWESIKVLGAIALAMVLFMVWWA